MAYLDLQSAPHRPTQHSTGQLFYRHCGKRVLDLVIAVFLVPILAPLIALLYLLVRADGAAGLFAHTRVGQGGTSFTCWKIRTMIPDAEARLSAFLATNPIAAAEWGRTQKLQNDPRVTRLGRFLRRTSLDELPQIWNVLRGEMSLVGPRPVTRPELARYGLRAATYLSLKPGVTGLWQVAGRSNGCYAERLQMDQTYALSIGMWRDLGLIGRTAFVRIKPTGR